MSHPQWGSVYEKPVELSGFIDNVYSHKEYFIEIAGRHPRRVLEVGVGGGSTSLFLTYLGMDVTAVDNNPQVVEAARQGNERLQGRLEIQVADAFKLPFADNSFDLVCHQGFFEHFEDEDIRKLVHEQLRVASTVIFSVPTLYYLANGWGERLMTRRHWEMILSPFHIEKSIYYGRPRSDSFRKRVLAVLGWKNIYYYCILTR